MSEQEAKLWDALRKHEDVSARALVKETGIEKPIVNSILYKWLKEGKATQRKEGVTPYWSAVVESQKKNEETAQVKQKKEDGAEKQENDAEGKESVEEQNKGKRTTNEDERIKSALALIFEFGAIQGAQHKGWLIDQILRALTDTEYNAFVKKWEGEPESDSYCKWCVGVAP